MSDSPYDDLAQIYDAFQSEIDSVQWAEYLDGLIRRFGPSKGDGKDAGILLCDLGCGTAGVSVEMNLRGYDVIGIDNSVRMLEKAREKAASAGADILFLCQDITQLELFGTVDVFVCLLDTVNHLIDPQDLQKMLRSFRNYLNPGGLFIFDTATPNHLKKTLGNHFFYTVEEEYALLWENRYSARTRISTSDLTLFRKTKKDTFRRYEGQIRERVYTETEICSNLERAGLKLIAGYGELSYEAPKEGEMRVFYVAQRPEETK